MLSKTERKILKQIVDITTKIEKKTLSLDTINLKEKIDTKNEINRLDNMLKSYLNKYSNNYKRVLKHRIIKKANLLIDDLILIHKTYNKIGIIWYAPLSYEKYDEFNNSLPERIKFVFQK